MRMKRESHSKARMNFPNLKKRFTHFINFLNNIIKTLPIQMAKFPDWAKKYCTNLWLSIKVVFSRIQVFFGISWILLIGASYLSNANYTIKAILWISFCFLLIYRFLCAVALTNRHTEAYKTLIRIEHVFILISLIGLIILGWFISYSSESVMGAVIILAVSYGVYCCSFSESRRIKFGLTNILLQIHTANNRQRKYNLVVLGYASFCRMPDYHQLA